MKQIFLSIALIFSLTVFAHAAELASNNFDAQDLGNWTVSRDKSMVKHVHDNANGYIHIIDENPDDGSNINSPLIKAAKGIYVGKMRVRQLDGMGFGMQIHAYDKDKNYLRHIGGVHLSSRAQTQDWFDITCKGYVDSEKIGYIQLRFGSWAKSLVDIMADDITLEYEPAQIVPPAWAPQYKIKPNETNRLTAADVVGPDSIVYPNWKRAGLQHPIPTTFKNTIKLSDFGGMPNDGKDDARAIDDAVKALAKRGGGLLQLDAGEYDMLRPVIIRADNITIAGQGTSQTKINFRYQIADGKVAFWGLTDGQTIGPKTDLVIFAPPANFKSFELAVDGTQCSGYHPSMHSGNRSYLRTTPEEKLHHFTPGKHQLTATAYYADGSTRSSNITINFDPNHVDTTPIGCPDGVLSFHGSGFDSDPFPIAEDAKRGSTVIKLANTHDLQVGQWIFVRANETPERRALVQNACNWGIYRNYVVQITKVENKTIHIDKPLRIDFPKADESYVMRLGVIQNGGVKNLTIEQTQDMWLTSVMFTNAVNCWAQHVNVIKCGRHPVYANFAAHCEIRDCEFTEAWFKGGGGTAYVGWEKTYDCLMDNVITHNMRHAPLFQWSAAGNVIRDSTFHNSDAQWHSGWTNENLMENCVITSVKGNGGYGFGMWASPPEDGAHGPNGPRNVVYNCDVTSPLAGIWVGGMNENWLILHNRIITDTGVGFYTKDNSFDHIIQGNVFVLKDQKSAMVKLMSPDCTGSEITNNQLYGGNGEFVQGLGQALLVQSNVHLPITKTMPKRPTPAVPSIFQWQRQSR
jgi:hypothetical protein